MLGVCGSYWNGKSCKSTFRSNNKICENMTICKLIWSAKITKKIHLKVLANSGSTLMPQSWQKKFCCLTDSFVSLKKGEKIVIDDLPSKWNRFQYTYRFEWIFKITCGRGGAQNWLPLSSVASLKSSLSTFSNSSPFWGTFSTEEKATKLEGRGRSWKN